MSDTFTTPVSTAFEIQRTAIQQGQEALERSVDFQQRVNRAVLNSLDSQAAAQRGTVELARTATHAYLDTVAATVPGADGTVDEIREVVDEQYEVLLENHASAVDEVEGQLETGLDIYEEAAQEFIGSTEAQIEALLAAHEDVEDQTLETVQEFEGQIEEFQGRLERQVEEVQKQVEEVHQQVTETAGQADA